MIYVGNQKNLIMRSADSGLIQSLISRYRANFKSQVLSGEDGNCNTRVQQQ